MLVIYDLFIKCMSNDVWPLLAGDISIFARYMLYHPQSWVDTPPLIKWLDPAHGFRHQFVKENHTSQSIPIAYPHYQYPFRIPSSIKKYIPYTVNIH